MRALVLLIPLLAFSSAARAADLGAVRLDLGAGICTLGGPSIRLGVAPELWWRRAGAGVRVAFDGDLESGGILSGEHDLVRLEPYALYDVAHGIVLGGGLGAAMMQVSPGFTFSSTSAVKPWKPVGTASLLAGWLGPKRRLGGLLRVDGNTGGTAAVSLELTFGFGWLAPTAR